MLETPNEGVNIGPTKKSNNFFHVRLNKVYHSSLDKLVFVKT
jgi:hypothetical protein